MKKSTTYFLRLCVILLAIALPLLLAAQPMELTSKNKKAQKYYLKATQYLQVHDEENAMLYTERALDCDRRFVEAWMLKGDIFDDQKKTKDAISCYLKATQLNPDFFSRNYFTLGRLETSIGRYEDAKKDYEKYLTYPSPNPNLKAKISDDLRNCNFAIEAMKHPVPFDPKNMGDSINTEFNEYSPTLTVDEQTFIITRQRPRDDKTIGSNAFEEDFYMSHSQSGTWSLARKMPPPINSHGNEGAQCISPDGQYMYLTICNREDGLGSCDLYYSKHEGNKWSSPVNMGNVVNSGAWDSQPTIAPDGKTIYFSSAREGGKGNMDIWKTTCIDGVWQKPVNLGDSINTQKSEMSPFIHPDGMTLYFTSNGHAGMGALDIYYVRMDTAGNFNHPVNIGFPINSYIDEGFLIVNGKGDKAYFASDILPGKGGLDLYTFDLYEAARPVTVNYMKGKVSDAKTGQRLDAHFELIDLETKKVVVESTSDKVTGEFLVSLPANRNYALNISKDGYLFFSENFTFKSGHPQSEPFLKDVVLQPLEKDVPVILENIFFDFDKTDLLPESQVELNKLIDFLKKNARVKIEISGHTDNKGTREYNLALSENRAKAVYEFLITHGVDKQRLTYKGYGFDKPIATNDTEEGRARNRRTEFKIVEL